MLKRGMHHPKEGRRRQDRVAKFFLFTAGVILLGAGVGHALVTGARSWGLIPGSAEWTDALMSLFYILAATECFTANITVWAGEVLRAILGKLTGTVPDGLTLEVKPESEGEDD